MARGSPIPLAGRRLSSRAERPQRLSGRNHSVVRAHNRCAILRALQSQGPTSRSHLTKLTGLKPATISSLVGELIEERVIHEIGTAVTGGMGRPTINLDFTPDGVFAVGVHIGVHWMAVGLVTPRGTIREMISFRRPKERDLAENLALAVDSIQSTLDRAGVSPDRLAGIGIGMPAIIDPRDGRVLESVDIGWSNAPIVEPFQTAFDVPVVIANNAQAMALAESWFGAGQGVDELALIYIASTVSAGFVVGGRLLWGAAWGAGQIGHCRVPGAPATRCSCGNVGCLETVLSQQALVGEAERADFQFPAHSLGLDAPEGAPVDALIEAARRGDTVAARVLTQAGEYLGYAATNVINLFNPSLIVLAGHLAPAGDLVFGPMRRVAADSALRTLVHHTRFEPSALGVRDYVIGPASLALVKCFYSPEQLVGR